MNEILNYLDELYPNAYCELNYTKDYELLIAIVLSAQTTDKRVNKVTPVLFNKYKTLEELANANLEDVENIIKEIGTFKKKSTFIKEIAKSLVENYNGVVPNDRNYLETLPGVGRKTTNVFLAEYYKVPAIAVDTHVERVSKRLKIAKQTSTVKEVENSLMKKIPKERWIKTHHQLIFFGRYHCKAIKQNVDIIKKKRKKVNKMNLSNKEIIHIFGENIDYIQFRKLLQYKDTINHAYTLRNNNINYGPNLTKEEYKNNYNLLCQELNLNVNNIIRPYQQHTSNVKVINVKDKDIEINPNYLNNVDGLITNKRDIILATTNADCILFLIYDPINKVIANVHSGWRGSLNTIVTNTLTEMHETYNSNYQDIICCICPSIHKCHFEVDKDVKELFYNKFKYLKNLDDIIEKKGNKYHIDTILLNTTIMLELGLKKENIIDSGICSVCYSKYINSYRKDKNNYKLSTAIITLK